MLGLYILGGCRSISDNSGQRRRFLAGICRWPLVEAAGGDDHAREGGVRRSQDLSTGKIAGKSKVVK